MQSYLQGSNSGKLLTVKIHKTQHGLVKGLVRMFRCVERGFQILFGTDLVGRVGIRLAHIRLPLLRTPRALAEAGADAPWGWAGAARAVPFPRW